jgi:hypothetical protein
MVLLVWVVARILVRPKKRNEKGLCGEYKRVTQFSILESQNRYTANYFFICVITRNVKKNHSTKKIVKRIKETNLKTRKNHI